MTKKSFKIINSSCNKNNSITTCTYSTTKNDNNNYQRTNNHSVDGDTSEDQHDNAFPTKRQYSIFTENYPDFHQQIPVNTFHTPLQTQQRIASQIQCRNYLYKRESEDELAITNSDFSLSKHTDQSSTLPTPSKLAHFENHLQSSQCAYEDDYIENEVKPISPPTYHHNSHQSKIIIPHARPIKRRRRLSPDETTALHNWFDRNPKPNSTSRAQIAKELSMSGRAIQIWFQNKRAKLRRDSLDPNPGLTFSTPPASVINTQLTQSSTNDFTNNNYTNNAYTIIDNNDISNLSKGIAAKQWNWHIEYSNVKNPLFSLTSDVLTPESPTPTTKQIKSVIRSGAGTQQHGTILQSEIIKTEIENAFSDFLDLESDTIINERNLSFPHSTFPLIRSSLSTDFTNNHRDKSLNFACSASDAPYFPINCASTEMEKKHNVFTHQDCTLDNVENIFNFPEFEKNFQILTDSSCNATSSTLTNSKQ